MKFNNYPTKIISKYTKSEINFNGEKLVELCIMNNLKIVNRFFKHKPIHLTTWQSLAPYVNITDCKTNTLRRKPFKNQIDCILVRNNTNTKVFDSKATIITTAIWIISLSLQKSSSNGNINQKLKGAANVSTYMKNQNIRKNYQNEIESYLIDNHYQRSNNQNLWNKIAKMLKQAAENTIVYVNK